MKAFRSLKNDYWKNRWRFLIGLLALFIVDLLQLLIPRVVKYAIDDLTEGGVTSSRLMTYGGAILLLAFGIGGFRYVWRYLLLGASRRIERALRDRLFVHLQTLSISYFARTKVGDLMAHATNDIEAVRMSIGLGLVFLVDTVILGILTVLFMIYIHPVLTLYAILPMPLITAVTLFFSRLIHQRFETLQKTFSALTERVRESISGIRVVKAYVLEEKEREKLGDLSQDYVQKNIHVTKIWGMFFPLLLFLSNFSMVIVLYRGGRLTIFQSISIGDFVAFMSYLGILAWPMMALGWAVNMIQRGGASLDRLNRILNETSEIQDGPRANASMPTKGKIEIRGLTFTPGNGAGPILKGVDLSIPQGERLVLAGRTGSGKTTLCHLIVRILESPESSIFFNETEIHRIPLEVLRRSIGFVPQDTFLFSDTIRENIAFGRQDATDQEIERAARIAQVWEDITGFPEGLHTRVGEKGVTLSGGQRQRVAIARAILMDPPFFILDDALSSVDIQTEERILEGLEEFLEGKTSILVTHRMAPLRKADRIVVLEGGGVAEVGSHGELLSRGGIYAEIYWRGQVEEELEQET
jgi:ATP-binding cassette subfamily B multidrug efflux pump